MCTGASPSPASRGSGIGPTGLTLRPAMRRRPWLVAVRNAAVTGTGAAVAPSSAAGMASVASAEGPISRSASIRSAGGDARDLPNPVRHGGAVDVVLRVFLADLRHVGQPPIVERAVPLRGQRDGGGEGGGTGDRGRMTMRDGRGECGLVGCPGGLVRA